MKARPTRATRTDYTPAHLEVLLTGHTYWPDDAKGFFRRGGAGLEPIISATQSLWERLRGELLPVWIAEYPGTRPAGWWWHDAPEPARRLLSGYNRLADPDAPAWTKTLVHGIPTTSGRREWDGVPTWESEAGFLRRHGLLSSDEAARLTNEDFEPETCT